jgi:hypothetical protein
MRGLVAVCTLVVLATATAALPCPPFGFDSVHNLDLAKFTTGQWHVQLQARGLRVEQTVLTLPLRSLKYARARGSPLDGSAKNEY